MTKPYMERSLEDTLKWLDGYGGTFTRTAAYLIRANMKGSAEIEQMAGQALGYPSYADDPKNFPGAEGPTVCVGDHVPESIVAELVDQHKQAKDTIEALKVELKNEYQRIEGLNKIILGQTDAIDGLRLANYHLSTQKDSIAGQNQRIVDRTAQLDVQLAGCLTAAEGHVKDPAKQGGYGWSPAYQAVLNLRLAYDQLKDKLAVAKARNEELAIDLGQANYVAAQWRAAVKGFAENGGPYVGTYQDWVDRAFSAEKELAEFKLAMPVAIEDAGNYFNQVKALEAQVKDLTGALGIVRDQRDEKWQDYNKMVDKNHALIRENHAIRVEYDKQLKLKQ